MLINRKALVSNQIVVCLGSQISKDKMSCKMELVDTQSKKSRAYGHSCSPRECAGRVNNIPTGPLLKLSLHHKVRSKESSLSSNKDIKGPAAV